MPPQQGGHWVGIAGFATFCRKAFTQRFIATIQTSNTWNPRSRCCNGRCPRDVFIRIPFGYRRCVKCIWISYKGYYIHIRRGLRSCLSKRGGKFEGLDCEISSEYGSHVFLCHVATYSWIKHILAGDRRSILANACSKLWDVRNVVGQTSQVRRIVWNATRL